MSYIINTCYIYYIYTYTGSETSLPKRTISTNFNYDSLYRTRIKTLWYSLVI